MAEIGSASVVVAEEEEEDSEWEYEYHETETETFYVTLDISSAAEYNKLPTNKRTKLDPSPPKVPRPTTLREPQNNVGPSELLETQVQETAEPMVIDPRLEQLDEEEPPHSEPPNRIQILDLHTKNPLISYQNQLYSCEWTSTLGTDILLTTPTPDSPHPVLREMPNVSLLATSSVKLMGRPVQLVSRPRNEETNPTPIPAPENISAPSAPTTNLSEAPTPVKIPLGATPSLARQNQASFLERLMAIKAKKGERDSVTIYTQKANQGTGWRSQRKASEAFDEEEEGDAEEPENVPKRGKTSTIGRPRGSRRRAGPRTAKGGLFRDYRPQLWDTPGADIRAGSSLTPESWDQLAGAGEASDGAIATPVPAERAASESTGSTSASTIASPTPSSQSPGPSPSLSPEPQLAATTVPPPWTPEPPSPSPALSLDPKLSPSRTPEPPSPSPALSLNLQTPEPDPEPSLLTRERQPGRTTSEQTPPPSDPTPSTLPRSADVEMDDVH